MAASTSRAPQDITLPPSPSSGTDEKATLKKKKGKGKEQTGLGSHTKRRVPSKATKCTPRNIDMGGDWEWATLADSYISKFPPVFTKDGSYFFSLAGPSVKVYSVSTGQVVSTLTPPLPKKASPSAHFLTCAVLNPHNVFQLITGSCDGRIIIWDFLEGALLRTIDVTHPVHHICVHENFKDSVFVAVTRPTQIKGKSTGKADDDTGVIWKVSLQTRGIGENPNIPMDSLKIGKTRNPTGLSISASGLWLVATASHKSYVASLASDKPRFTKLVSPERITCLALHPTEDYFATGDAKGVVRLWYCLDDSVNKKVPGVEKRTQTATLHWHAHAVSSLTFSPNGAYLLSGGEEAVLVVWQLETGKKEYIPRLGSAINSIAVLKRAQDEDYLCSLVDGTFVFVNAAALQIKRSFSRIRLDPQATTLPTSKQVPTPIVEHSTSSTLVLPSSHPSSLQIFSLISSKIVSELEVAPSNRVSRREDKPLDPPRVERIAISSSGDWMATIDRREGDGAVHSEVYLKIWRWDQLAGIWILNTRIDRPHGPNKVTDVAFSPAHVGSSMALLVTTGEDGDVRMWRLKQNKDQNASEFWVAQSTFDFRGHVPKHVSWSPDASLLAIAFPRHAILYDPITTIQQCAIPTTELTEITSCHFIGSTGRYLVIRSTQDFVVWDLIAQKVILSRRHAAVIDQIIPNAFTDSFAIVSRVGKRTRVVTISCASTREVIHQLPFTVRAIAPLSSHFVAITQDWSLVRFGDNVLRVVEEGSSARSIHQLATSSKNTLFQDIFGKSAFAPRQAAPAVINVSEASTIRPLFDGPSYMMPPMASLFDDAMSGFMHERVENASDEVDVDGDVDMEEPSEPLVLAKPMRAVSKEEMTAFVDMFKHTSLQPKHRPQPQPRVKSNGIAKANGHNGKTPVKTPTKAIVAPSTPTSMPSSPVLIANGKKRKKVD
ncbi:WD40 repeat-like protein [Cylindrobasidium torrendii FP15055 ss-10]|uniref:WD40 repeat-like protein n=1 Tax=Cylindrobasidium torrendii FP15055 ss-10 TaxID=1314674 RepID=A0A0D7B9H7_9AGAR|nr:WD40 repeat-like protein [Cylindrobasidium torrendii FP15055 ss-10]